MGICFIGDVNVNDLLKKRLGEKPGEVVYKGEVVGSHRGLWFYTIGERKGFELDKRALKKIGIQPERMAPLYVTGKDREKNQLIVGEREEAMKSEFKILDSRFEEGDKLWVRIRNLGELHEVVAIKDGVVKITDRIFAVAEGQSAVFYDEDKVLVGGSIIV
jgi:tRNA-specific 2-thiouridylase